MTTMLVITLIAGAALGLFFGVPLGRFLERVRPTKKPKKKSDEEKARR